MLDEVIFPLKFQFTGMGVREDLLLLQASLNPVLSSTVICKCHCSISVDLHFSMSEAMGTNWIHKDKELPIPSTTTSVQQTDSLHVA